VDEVNALVAGLGSDEFSERESAARRLERMGTTALPALRNACKSSDPEVRRRAASLVERIERTAESARLLTVAPVTFNYVNVPLGTAAPDSRSLTRIPIALDPDGVANPSRPITVTSGPLPPWQALEVFCKAAGLKESFQSELPPPKPTIRRLGRGMEFTP